MTRSSAAAEASVIVAKSGNAISAELLALLRCPVTHQRLILASVDVIGRIEAQRADGTLRDKSGRPLETAVTAGLQTEDGKRFYPIRENLPVLLDEESIILS